MSLMSNFNRGDIHRTNTRVRNVITSNQPSPTVLLLIEQKFESSNAMGTVIFEKRLIRRPSANL